MPQSIEEGEIHFFYRVKLDVDKPSGVDDLERVFLALVPDDRDRARLFIVGRKKLPKIILGESDPTERHWLLLSMVDAPKSVGKALHPVQYETKTKGERQTSEAIPVGSGRCVIAARDDATQLAYRLSAPSGPGTAQDDLQIRDEARYVIAVRNPSVDVTGFPDAKPDYPEDLARKFADERRIDVSDPRLLDHETAQLVLIGAEDEVAPLEIESDRKVDVFATLGLDRNDRPDAALQDGSFAAPKEAADPVRSEGYRSKGGKRGGAQAAETNSAAGVASARKGVPLPADSRDLVRHAKGNDAPEEDVALLETIPDGQFDTMADVTKAIGEVR